MRDEVLQPVRIVDPDIEVAVGGKEDAVHLVLGVVELCELIGLADAFPARRRTAGRQPVEGREDLCFLVPRRRLEHGARRARIDHHRDRVVGGELVDQQADRLLDERQLVGLVHRARHVEQEDEVRGRTLLRLHLIALDADMHEKRVLVPGRGIDLDRGRERRVGAFGGRIIVIEVIDELLGPHRVPRRQRAAREIGARDAVRRRVNVDREGGDRLLGHDLFRIGRGVGVFFGVLGRRQISGHAIRAGGDHAGHRCRHGIALARFHGHGL